MALAVETGSVASASQVATAGVTSYTVSSFNMPSVTDPALLVFVRVNLGSFAAVSQVTGVTWNGNAMAEEFEQLGDNSNHLGVWIFSLIGAGLTTGTNDLVVSLASTSNDVVSVTFVPLSGANQTDLCGTGDGAQSNTGTSQSDSYTTTGTDSLIIGGICGHGDDQDPYTPKTSNVEVADGDSTGGVVNGLSYWVGYMSAASAGAYTFGADASVSDGWAIAEIEVFVASGGGGGFSYPGIANHTDNIAHGYSGVQAAQLGGVLVH